MPAVRDVAVRRIRKRHSEMGIESELLQQDESDSAKGEAPACAGYADEVIERALVCDMPACGGLTRREEQILRLIVSGKTNKQIAKSICRSERTVEYHRNRLMRKIGAGNAADLVKRAIVMGII